MSEEVCGIISGAPECNPLLLDVVLGKLFENLCLKDLLRCRLVCKCWCRNSRLTSLIREMAVVDLRSIYLYTSTTTENIEDYFKIGGVIYTHYHFENISFRNAFVSKFLTVIGPAIQRLVLHLDLNQLNLDQFREVVYKGVPNLKVLNIHSLSHEEVFLKPMFPDNVPQQNRPENRSIVKLELQEIRLPIVNFMSDLMSTLKNLKEIVLKTDVCSDWLEQSEMWRENSAIATSVIQGLQNSGAFKTLKVFRCGKLKIEHLDYLLKMGQNGLRLQIWELHVPLKEAESIFSEFLHTQRDSLRELIIFEQRGGNFRKMCGGHQDFILKLPDIMHKLELLQLSKYYKTAMVPMHPVDFTRQCPRLKRLLLIGRCGEKASSNNLYIPSEKSASVSEVTLWSRICDAEAASILSRAFSNLMKLHVRYPTPEFLTLLWKECSQIQFLTLLLDETPCMNEAVTGISENDLMEGITSEENMESICSHNSTNSILNLKGLRSLKITVDHNIEHERQALSDAAGYMALRKMNTLQYLQLFSSDWQVGLTNCLFFSKQCQMTLKQDLDRTVVCFCPDALH